MGNLVSQVQPRDTNDQEVLSPLVTTGNKHVIMSITVTKGPTFIEIR